MKKILLLFASLFLLTGCGTYSQSVQVDDKAYLLLIGEPVGYFATIDDGKKIDLANDVRSFNLNGKKAIKIQVSIGSHNLKITNKAGDLTVNRNFYVSTGISFEVQL